MASETCNICKKLLDQPNDPSSKDRGGNCQECMTKFENDLVNAALENLRGMRM